MKTIPLTQNLEAIVDDDDYNELIAINWYTRRTPNGDCYAQANKKINGKWTTIQMHRFILGITNPSIDVDHINHNGLDNRRENIRACTRKENSYNQRAVDGSSSQYKGVRLHHLTGKWEARSRLHGTLHYLGLYGSEVEAAQAVDAFMAEHHGEFANLNLS